VAAAPRRTLHDALLGTTAVVLLGVLGGIGYFVWSGAVPGATAFVQPFADFAAKAVTRAVSDPAPPSPSGKDAPADPVASRPMAPLAPSSVTPDHLAPAPPLADKPALAGPPPPAPDRAAAELAPSARPSKPDAAAPAPALPVVTAAGGPAPEPGATVAVSPAQSPEPVAAPPVASGLDKVALAIEPAAAQAVPPAMPSVPDTAPAVPAMASVTVRLPAAPEWMTVSPAALASLPEAVPLPPDPPAFPAGPASPVPSDGPATASAEAAKAAAPGVVATAPPVAAQQRDEQHRGVEQRRGEVLGRVVRLGADHQRALHVRGDAVADRLDALALLLRQLDLGLGDELAEPAHLSLGAGGLRFGRGPRAVDQRLRDPDQRPHLLFAPFLHDVERVQHLLLRRYPQAEHALRLDELRPCRGRKPVDRIAQLVGPCGHGSRPAVPLSTCCASKSVSHFFVMCCIVARGRLPSEPGLFAATS
jgi:hypothetical protein